MLRKFIPIFILLFLASCSSPQDYSQTYIIILNSKKGGTVIVNEKTDRNGNRICLAEQEVNIFSAKDKKKNIIQTRMVFPEGNLFPSSYSCKNGSDVSYELKVNGNQIIRTINNKEGTKEKIIPLEPEMRMLDLMIYHTVEYWIRKYDKKKGGIQIFQTYLLPYDSIEKISVSPGEIILPEHETSELELKNYEIEIRDGLKISLWVDKDSHMYRMFVHGPNVEVIREDLFLKIEKDYKQQGENL